MYEYVTYPLYVLLQDVTGGCIGVVTFEAFSSKPKIINIKQNIKPYSPNDKSVLTYKLHSLA